MKKIQLIILLFLSFVVFGSFASEYNGRHGWPEQKAPKKLITCDWNGTSEAMLLQSLSGLAAQAVNEGRFDTMIWMNTDNASYAGLYDASVQALKITEVSPMNLWDVVRYLKRKGVVRGYVLYKADKPRENNYASYADTDYSANVATVYASLLKGVLIEESQEAQARRCGLKRLKDARHESARECFLKNRKYLNNHSALSIPAGVHHMRDYAIAHKLMLYADQPELIDEVLEWVTPLSPILGWGCGDEYDFTSVISRWGHYNTATNWCLNLPFISSVGECAEVGRNRGFNPSDIDFSDDSSFHTFVMSDGDNVQWSMGSYADSEMYMGNPHVRNLGVSWTLCPTELSVISPFTWNRMLERQGTLNSILEYGGGYQYPDLFAVNRPNRTELLRKFARRINHHLEKLDIHIFGFLCRDVASAEAQEAFQIYAEEMPQLAGMLAVQYFPYELEGEIYWKTNREGVDIPVVTSRYSLWNEVNPHRPRCRDVSRAGRESDSCDLVDASAVCKMRFGRRIVVAYPHALSSGADKESTE